MAEADRMLGMYLHLARASHMRRQPMVRDKLLVLAGVQAQHMGLEQISALCRHKILSHNTRHLLRWWPTLTAAMEDEKFQSYFKQLKRRYSPEKIEHMVHSLGIELGREREAYFSDLEYAAALLDTRPDSIAGILADNRSEPADTVGSASRAKAAAARPKHARAPWSVQRLLNFLIVWGPWLLVAFVASVVTFVRALVH